MCLYWVMPIPFVCAPRDCETQTMEPDTAQDWQTKRAHPARRGARLVCQSTVAAKPSDVAYFTLAQVVSFV